MFSEPFDKQHKEADKNLWIHNTDRPLIYISCWRKMSSHWKMFVLNLKPQDDGTSDQSSNKYLS